MARRLSAGRRLSQVAAGRLRISAVISARARSRAVRGTDVTG